MQILLIVLAAIAVLTLVALALSPRIVQQDQEGALFRLGRMTGINGAGGADERIPPGTVNHGR